MATDEPTTSDNTSYDFILKTEEPEQKPLLSRLNKKRLLIFMAVIATCLITLGIVMSSLNAKADAAQKQRLVQIAQLQTEIVRVAGIGAEKAVKPENQSRARAIRDGIGSSLDTTIKLLGFRGETPTDETLAATKNPETDTSLDKAAVYGTFDRTFEKLIDKQILDYQRVVLAADKAGNTSERKAMESAYNQANSMLGLVDQK